MKINVKQREIASETINNLNAGDVFEHNNDFFVKVANPDGCFPTWTGVKINAIRLRDGNLHTFSDQNITRRTDLVLANSK